MDTIGSANQSEDIPAWVNRLTIAVLAPMLFYAMIGLPVFNRDAALASDYVNPLNRFIWLGLLGLATPIAVARWRSVLSLLGASWPLLLLYTYFFASTFWALDPDASTRRMIFTLVQLLLAAVLLSGLKKSSTLHILLALVCILAAVEDLAAWVLWPGVAMTDDGLAGVQTQKNQTGLMMMYGCFAAASVFFLIRGRLARVTIMGSIALMGLLLVATRSTTSQAITLLAPFVMPVILGVACLRKRVIWAVAASIPAAVMALFFGYIAWCGIVNYDPWLPLRGVTFTSRLDLWVFAVEEIAKRPWFGVGYSSFWAINPAVQPSLKTGLWFGTYALINEAHQGYLDLILTTGFVGFAGGMAVVFRTMGIAGRAIVRADPVGIAARTGRLAYPTAALHMATLVAMLVHNFTESDLFSNNSMLGATFVLTALDLEKWRLATRQPKPVRFPNPAPYRPLGSGRQGEGLA